MVDLKIHSFLVFGTEYLGNSDVLTLCHVGRRARVRVDLFSKGFEVRRIVFDAFKKLLFVGVVTGGDGFGECGFDFVYSGRRWETLGIVDFQILGERPRCKAELRNSEWRPYHRDQ